MVKTKALISRAVTALLICVFVFAYANCCFFFHGKAHLLFTVVQLTSDQIDSTLMNLQAGLDLAFQRAKAWSKYLKDIMVYIERRAQLGKVV